MAGHQTLGGMLAASANGIRPLSKNTSDSMKILNGWKEIAVYLETSVRTVQRWESTEGLPVRRHLHRKRGSVYAIPSEVEEWRRRRSLDIRERIRGELGRQFGELQRLTKQQQALADELRRVIDSNHEIWTRIERQFKK